MESFKLPKHLTFILNQVFEIEKKLSTTKEPSSIQRNIDKLKNYFETEVLPEGQGLIYHNPVGESYNETRTDCDATISGGSHENLEIIEVLKPIIYIKFSHTQTVIQKAIVIVQSRI